MSGETLLEVLARGSLEAIRGPRSATRRCYAARVARPKAEHFLTRDWAAFDALLDEHIRKVHEEGGVLALIEMADRLRAHARAARPDWPTRSDRARDQRHHERLIAILDRVPARRR